MSRTQMVSVQARYSPIKDAVQRHEGGVSKSKKAALTGSGRAWREDEEAYLLQTRLQKMPYKHIAAHLHKTELACRLHYHQLSHGSTRRKRTPSFSSGSSDLASGQPGLEASPILESKSRSISPAHAVGNYVATASTSNVQLPSIMTADRSHRLPAILPKPEPGAFSRPSESPRRYPNVMSEQPHEHLPSVSFQHGNTSYHSPTPPLRLDCRGLSPPSTSVLGPAHVDLPRLHSIYEAHRNSFWAAIADDYGPNMSPVALEQAWRTGVCCPQHGSNPMTPAASPDKDRKPLYRSSGQDKTRISSILGVDMEPKLR
ncbi:hypothetical protein TOPH_04559 [Tolypocladium ophioglossoides CBS 100239]|uniref:Myb-like domain-containing protein n=1 Tax=Tolypocladium ophioglossoides (strain CBS 100239) TaxID=1163406 RepID=A0A0L0N9R7_TOLOC|nr:hypothetical protein TOPH_04559 [Tolypocladium ophioglossoides CBS 100239]